MASGYVGHLREFTLRNDWSIFKGRLDNYFTINAIESENTKRALFLNSCDEEAYKLILSLCVPKKPDDLQYSELILKLDKHFKRSDAGFSARYRFYNAQRENRETIQDWLARVQGLASHCYFQDQEFKTMVRDKFIMGMGRGIIMDRLFEEDVTSLSIEKSLEIALNKEATAHLYDLGDDSVRIRENCHAQRVRSPEVEHRSGSNRSCDCCGYRNHKADNCKFKNVICFKCGQRGHLRRVCAKKSGATKISKTTHYMKEKKENVTGSEDEGNDFITESLSGGAAFCSTGWESQSKMEERRHTDPLFNISGGKKISTFDVEVLIEGKPVVFSVDTGSSLTLMPLELYTKTFSHIKLQETNKCLVTYCGSTFSPLGRCTVGVKFNEQVLVDQPLYVVDTKGPPLLGRDWFCAFKLKIDNGRVFSNMQVNAVDPAKCIAELKSKYPTVFTEEIGIFNRGHISINLKPDAQPKFIRARPLPHAMKELVEVELDRLVKNGIIEPVDYSPWGSPIVPILKKGKNKSVRICGDYKTTINPCIEIDQHPLPRIDTLFENFQGCAVFCKLDLRCAYQQFALDKKSQDLLTITTHKGLFRCKRLWFGVASAPAKFQKCMDSTLQGLEGTSWFLDDILVGAADTETLLIRVEAVLKRLRNVGLTLAEEKCEFFKSSVVYLGFRIDHEGLHLAEDKIKAIVDAPRPSSVSELQSFLGFINYVIRFIPRATDLLHPLYQQLHKNCVWKWSSDCEKSFNRLKQIVVSPVVLAHYNPNFSLTSKVCQVLMEFFNHTLVDYRGV